MARLARDVHKYRGRDRTDDRTTQHPLAEFHGPARIRYLPPWMMLREAAVLPFLPALHSDHMCWRVWRVFLTAVVYFAPSPSVSLPTPPVKLPHVHPAFTQYSTIIVTTPLCDSNCLSTSGTSYLQCAASIAECSRQVTYTYWFNLTRMHLVNWQLHRELA